MKKTAARLMTEDVSAPIPSVPSEAEERRAALVERELKFLEFKALSDELKALKEAQTREKPPVSGQVYRGVNIIAMKNPQSLTIVKPKIFIDKEDPTEASRAFFV